MKMIIVVDRADLTAMAVRRERRHIAKLNRATDQYLQDRIIDLEADRFSVIPGALVGLLFIGCFCILAWLVWGISLLTYQP